MSTYKLSLPSEVYARIPQFSLTPELLVLARTSKVLQKAAERFLYKDMVLQDPNTAFHACCSLIAPDSISGPYVNRFWFSCDPRRHRQFGPLPLQFWQVIQAALTKMPNLEELTIIDPKAESSWILEPSHLHFQLKRAKLRLPWSRGLVAFLHSQHQLQYIQVSDSFEDLPSASIDPGKLLSLERFDGPILVAFQFIPFSLTHIRILTDEETYSTIPTFISHLLSSSMPLRSLSIVYIHEDYAVETLLLLTSTTLCRQLRHFGTLCLPRRDPDRAGIHRYLTKMTMLEVLEVELSLWEPQPFEPSQRIFAMGLRTACPTLRLIIFWLGNYRFQWTREDDVWTKTRHTGFARDDNQWQLI